MTLQNAGTTHYLQTAGTSTLTNTTINLQDGTPTTRFTQNNGTTTLTNATLRLADNSKTAYQHSGTTTTMRNATIELTDNTPTTRFSQTSTQTSITNTNIGTNGILTQTGQTRINGAFTTESSAVTLKDSAGTPVTHFLQNATATTITNATINLQDQQAVPVTRFSQTNGTSSITNTNINTNGILLQTGNFTANGAEHLLQNLGVTRFRQIVNSTTLTNQNIILEDGTATTRFLQTNTATTITNTNIATNGILTQTGASTLTSGTANNTITTTTGTNTMSATGLGSNVMSSANTTATANLITATAGLGGNTMRTTTGDNKLFVTSTSTSNAGHNYMEVAGGNGGNILKAIGAGTASGGYNSIVGRNNYYDISPNTGSHYIRVGASGSEVNKIVVNSTTTTITNTSINLTGNVYASSYSMGTSVSSSHLFSFQVHGTKQGGTDPDGTIIMNPMYDTTTNRCFNYCMPCHVVFTKVVIMYDIDSSTSTTMGLKFIKKTSNAGAETTLGYSNGITTTNNNTTSYTQVFNLISPTLLIGAEYSADDIMKVEYTTSPTNEWGIVFHGYQLS